MSSIGALRNGKAALYRKPAQGKQAGQAERAAIRTATNPAKHRKNREKC
jgi:hypothetical protein